MILMGIFNYIDTFFFISLGITFILILLLVFHFKQRMTDLENKSETMFEIINNIVKEITSIKQMPFLNSCCEPKTCAYVGSTVVEHKNVITLNDDKIIVSDDDSDDEDEDDDSDDDSSDDEYDSDEIPALQILENNVKIISVDMGDVIEIEEPALSEDNEESEEPVLENVQLDNLKVEKVEEPAPGEEETKDNITAGETSKEIYRKMTLPALKSLVITKGLSSDPSKLKKQDLLKLLESE